MKVIIAGSRKYTDPLGLLAAIELSGFTITEVISGGARGVDRLGEYYAEENNIPLKIFRADWDGLGKGAGHIRNGEMANYGEGLIAVWDGKSKGTKSMISKAERKGLYVYIHIV